MSIHSCPSRTAIPEPRMSHAASLTAAIQKARGGAFESNILLCVTSHSSPLGNRNSFTHLIVFLTGNQLCLSLRSGRDLVFQVTGLNPGDKIFMRPGWGIYISLRSFPLHLPARQVSEQLSPGR